MANAKMMCPYYLLRILWVYVKMYMVIKMEEKIPERKPTRARNYNYSSVGAYFVTICTKNRAEILSNIVGGDTKQKGLRKQ